MNATMTLPEKMVDYVELTSKALEKAAAEQTVKEAVAAKVASLIPKAVDALVAGERIGADKREKAAAMLADPVQALELLIKVAGHRNRTEQAVLGQGVDPNTKTASAGGSKPAYNSVEDCRPGMRTTMEKQSDLALKRGLGLTT